jgi:DNA replication initiation complex subunit (GINS family)
MIELISYEELRKIQNAERDNTALQEIDPAFFERVREYIKIKKKIVEENKNRDNTFSKQTLEKSSQELRNIYKILEDICTRRYRKLVTQAVTNVTAKIHNTEKMLEDEEELYNKMVELLKQNKEAFIKTFEEKPAPEKLVKAEGINKLIRIKDEVQSFMWKDSKTYGPFIKEDIANLPIDVGEILIKQGKAIEIVLGENNNEDAKANNAVLPDVQKTD